MGPDLHSAGALRRRPRHSFDDILQARPANLPVEGKSPLSVYRLGWPASWAVGDVPKALGGQAWVTHVSPLTSHLSGRVTGAEVSHPPGPEVTATRWKLLDSFPWLLS